MDPANTSCVVCGRETERAAAQYANAWERSRKKFPCCSETCAKEFDSDVHWIPAELPAVAEGDEAIALRQMARQRLLGLNEARPVVRELLLAGLAPETLRFFVAESSDATRSAKAGAARTSALGFLKGLFLGGRTVVAESRDQRSPKSYADANADLDQWEAAVAARSK